MNRQEILDRLRENEAALRAQGVAHAALFGSVARGEARPDSDIDIMVEIAPEIPIGRFSVCRNRPRYRGFVSRAGRCFQPRRFETPCPAKRRTRCDLCLLSPLGRSISSCMISAADSDEASHAFQ